MNALWRPEAKSNRALAGGGCRAIVTLAQQGLRLARAGVFDAEDVDLPLPDAASHVGVLGLHRQQPAGQPLGQIQRTNFPRSRSSSGVKPPSSSARRVMRRRRMK